MDVPAYLSHLRSELDALAACLGGDLSAPVRHCGDWSLYDLADHVGNQNLWVVAAVTEGHGKHRGSPPPREPAAPEAWFAGTAGRLLATLDADPATPAWTFQPPHTVGFWQRRRALETLIHRWDAQRALGAAEALDPELAAD
ncbi:MAG: maleylpyruvate isomerase family mycothiol-dependent enzyme, partial [Streptosporangiales bacterium]|nr:maleylpyruvate isomerase family mycothiol-dependent enzyme [Streptosporangiales bacterium]